MTFLADISPSNKTIFSFLFIHFTRSCNNTFAYTATKVRSLQNHIFYMFIKLKTNRCLAIHEQSLILFPFYVRFFLKVFLYYFNSIYYLPCINRYINTYRMVYKMLIQKRIKIGQFYSYKTCLWLFWFELIFCINFLFSICHKYLFYFGKVIWWLVSDYG